MKSPSDRRSFRLLVLLPVLALVFSLLACSLGAKVTPAPQPTATRRVSTPTSRPTATQELPANVVRTWASAAEASSEFGSSSWTAMQAAGAPDTNGCGDYGTSWASASSSSVDTLTLYYYDQPVIPYEVNIIQTYNPSQVVKVELIDALGQFYDVTIYESAPQAVSQCPYTLSIPVSGVDYLVMGVRITIDQSILGLGWNEIDAVELVGIPGEGSVAIPGSEPIAGFAGVWQDPETTDHFDIIWDGTQYRVKSVTWGTSSYAITSQYWDGTSLTWTYYDTDLPMSVTYTTTGLSGDYMYVNWSYNDGSYGTETLDRIR